MNIFTTEIAYSSCNLPFTVHVPVLHGVAYIGGLHDRFNDQGCPSVRVCFLLAAIGTATAACGGARSDVFDVILWTLWLIFGQEELAPAFIAIFS